MFVQLSLMLRFSGIAMCLWELLLLCVPGCIHNLHRSGAVCICARLNRDLWRIKEGLLRFVYLSKSIIKKVKERS